MNSGNLEKKNFRVTPNNEDKESNNLDAMIVIPAYDEEIKILHTIYSAVRQKISSGKDKIKHGIVVTINNSPDSPVKVKQNNFSTYLLLQALEHKFPIKIKENQNLKVKSANKMISEIQNSNVPIHVIDAFSDYGSNENNNVGTARMLGTDYALKKLKPEGFFISTDSDTILAREIIEATKLLFDSNDYGAVRYQMYLNLLNTSQEEKETSVIYNLSKKLKWMVDGGNKIDDTIPWTPGGGTGFKKSAFEKIKGYSEIPGHEDTEVGKQIADAGYRIYDSYNEDADTGLYVSTRARVSERTSVGFGRRIATWSEKDELFMNKKIDSPEFFDERNSFLDNTHVIYSILFLAWEEKQKKEHPHRKIDLKRFLKETKNKAIDIFGDLCEKTFALDQKDFFKNNYPELEEDISQLVYIFSKWNPFAYGASPQHELYWQTEKIFKKLYPEISIFSFVDEMEKYFTNDDKKIQAEKYFSEFGEDAYKSPYTYQDFERRIMTMLKGCGLDLDENNLRTKVKTILLYHYNNYSDKIEKTIKGLDAIKSIDKELQKEKAESIVLPKEIIFLQLNQSFRENVCHSIEEVWETLSYHEDKKLVKVLEFLLVEVANNYNEFISKVYTPMKQDFSPNFEKNIETLQESLKKAEKDEQTEDE